MRSSDLKRDREIIKISVYGIVVNVVLVVFKAVVGLIANSISIVLDALNNLTDAAIAHFQQLPSSLLFQL